MNQALSRRKIELITALREGGLQGAYWGIGTDIDKYSNGAPFFTMNDQARQQASVRTRLDSFSESEQGELINWGYAVCNAAIEKHATIVVRHQQPPKWPKNLFPL